MEPALGNYIKNKEMIMMNIINRLQEFIECGGKSLLVHCYYGSWFRVNDSRLEVGE